MKNSLFALQMTDHPFYIGNLSNVIKRVKLFKSTFPQVQPFYGKLNLLRIFHTKRNSTFVSIRGG